MVDFKIENATAHDFRRTVGTNLARLGVSKDIRARVLNHIDGASSAPRAAHSPRQNKIPSGLAPRAEVITAAI